MFGTELEFAAGTTEDCKALVMRLFEPADVLAAYRLARRRFGSPDVVLVASAHDADGFETMLRAHYLATLRRGLGRQAGKLLAVLGIAGRSAHQVAGVPADSNALWLVINHKDQLPVMVVLFAMQYALGADAREPTIARS